MELEEALRDFHTHYKAIREGLGRVIIGHENVLDNSVIALIAGGHVLLEGVPGLGKTLLVRTLSKLLQCDFKRIQFTPDLMPADITGTNIVSEHGGERRFVFQKGPIFGNVILADEINRATPKTQSALLEAMQEESVTIAGTSYQLDRPFFVLATQNPIEMEGTYPLPEAQLDRFLFKLQVFPSNVKDLSQILTETSSGEMPDIQAVCDGQKILGMRSLAQEVPIARHLIEYVAHIILASHPNNASAPEMVKRYIRYGASPRGGQAIIRAAQVRALAAQRSNVAAEDIQALAFPALRHRILLNFEGEAEGIDPDDIIRSILEAVPEIPETIKEL